MMISKRKLKILVVSACALLIGCSAASTGDGGDPILLSNDAKGDGSVETTIVLTKDHAMQQLYFTCDNAIFNCDADLTTTIRSESLFQRLADFLETSGAQSVSSGPIVELIFSGDWYRLQVEATADPNGIAPPSFKQSASFHAGGRPHGSRFDITLARNSPSEEDIGWDGVVLQTIPEDLEIAVSASWR